MVDVGQQAATLLPKNDDLIVKLIKSLDEWNFTNVGSNVWLVALILRTISRFPQHAALVVHVWKPILSSHKKLLLECYRLWFLLSLHTSQIFLSIELFNAFSKNLLKTALHDENQLDFHCQWTD